MNSTKIPVHNYLTFDIEEWYHANYAGYAPSKKDLAAPTNLDALVDRFLELCSFYKVKATFFVVGSVAKRKPHIVKSIIQHGHEVASHSYNHELVYAMTPKQFEQDAVRSKNVLEDITGKRVYGYRAPSWSVREECLLWYYSALQKHGYRYSSSVFPLKTFLYGIPNAPRFAFIPQVGDTPHQLLEIPCSTSKILGKTFGFSGGFYMRCIPQFFIERWTRELNTSGHSTIFYLHPREIDLFQPKIALPFFQSFLHYYGVDGCEAKLTHIMQTFQKSLQHTMKEYTQTILQSPTSLSYVHRFSQK